MYKQVFDPVGDSLGLSSIFAAIPIIVLFVLLGGLTMKAHWAALIALGAAILVALIVYGMPVGQALDSAAEGGVFGIFPIMYIVFMALWIYNMTVETGHFVVLRRAFNRISDDQRIQAVIIAFAFGALLEALAGFGTPVAITGAILITLGLWIAGVGGILGLFSPIIGWLGVAVTGSDTSSNSLFGALQVSAAKEAGLDQTLLAAANSSGGVLGKMISPQNLAVGAAAVGLAGREGELFRRVIGWSLLLVVIMCVLVYLQTTAVLSWMVV
jgi:L-lactate permease